MSSDFTLWQLLQEQEIEIPRIQRDYAQGRRGKEHIRSAFLKDILNCLTDNLDLTLDFVYGNTENGKFYPLDGQQRLTTLWLVHWYLAFRLGCSKTDKEILGRFTYQTRDSSEAFCKKLCEMMLREEPQDHENITAYVKNQNWFFSEWMRDPTVDAMLRTLSGDGRKEDNIQAIFCELDNATLNSCWKNLIEKRNITFQLMVIGTEKLPISDDLYIKMNARGKKLTDFENFKADWIAHLNSDEYPRKNNNDLYSQKIDGDWTDVFWNSRLDKEDSNIDSIFFSFINRYILNLHCLTDPTPSHYNSRKNPAGEDDAELKKLQEIFDVLYGTGLGKGKNPNDDSLIEYTSFKYYEKYITPEMMENLDRIFRHLKEKPDCLKDINFSSLDENEDIDDVTSEEFRFIPRQTKSKGLEPTRLKERIYFHALCLFLEDEPVDSDHAWGQMKNWMRIVRNLTENGKVEDVDSMIRCLQEIDRLGRYLRKKQWYVYENLLPGCIEKEPEKQWPEELKKAEKIRQSPEMKTVIQSAEDFAFFNGTISFLFNGPKGSDAEPDWDHFEEKFENAKKLFRDPKEVPPSTVKRFLGRFKTFKELPYKDGFFFTTIGYDRRKNCWKTGILCNQNVSAQVHDFLLDEPLVAEGRYKTFLKSGAIEGIRDSYAHYNYSVWYHGDWTVRRHRSHTDGIYISPKRLERNRQLKSMLDQGLQLAKEHVFYDDFLWGEEINFTYRGKEYCWDYENYIYAEEKPNDKKTWDDNVNLRDILKALA